MAARADAVVGSGAGVPTHGACGRVGRAPRVPAVAGERVRPERSWVAGTLALQVAHSLAPHFLFLPHLISLCSFRVSLKYEPYRVISLQFPIHLESNPDSAKTCKGPRDLTHRLLPDIIFLHRLLFVSSRPLSPAGVISLCTCLVTACSPS